MGRELKRVALDFDWPLDERWKGYLNPHGDAWYNCKVCGGHGYSKFYKHLEDMWYGNASFKPEDRGSVPFTGYEKPIARLVERNALGYQDMEVDGTLEQLARFERQRLTNMFNGQWSHHLNQGDVDVLIKEGRLRDLTQNGHIPTVRDVNLWSIGGWGHDSMNLYYVAKAECERLGKTLYCDACDGESQLWVSDAAKKEYEEWECFEPPEGPGYQIWETVSEGSPISPVFSTPEDLARHMATTQWGADKGTSVEQWLAFINGPGWAPSMVGTPGKLVSGVQAV